MGKGIVLNGYLGQIVLMYNFNYIEMYVDA